MFKRAELISAFDIENDLVKLAQVSVDDSGRSLYRLVGRKVQGGLAGTIRAMAADYKVFGTRVLINLPRHKVTVKNIKLPSVNPAEIESMVALQAAKQLPFPPEEIISSYRILGKDKKGYSDVMMALVHRDAARDILKAFADAGVEVERLVLSSEAHSLWYLQRQKEDEKKSSICLIDAGRSILEIEIIKEGALIFTRSVSFSSPADIEKRIVDEIKNTLLSYEKAFAGPDVTKLILTGRRSLIEKEAAILKKELGLSTVYVDTLRLWPKRPGAALPKEEEFSGESFTAVLSLGFNYDRLETNLIPQEIRLKRVSKAVRERLVLCAALVLSVSLGMAGIAANNFIEKKRFLASINAKLDEAKPQVERLSKLKNVTDVIKRQIDIRGSSIDIIRELYGKIPPEITLTIFDYDEGRSCLLRGTSRELSYVFKFVSTLEESAYFENVKVRYATKRATKDKEFTDFEITCDLTRIETNKNTNPVRNSISNGAKGRE